MIETLISSKTRIKLLLRFFLNSSTSSYLRSLESELGESTNGIRLELNRLEKAGMLLSSIKGNKKMFTANREHPLFQELNSIVLKYIGFDKIIDQVVEKMGDVRQVYVVGEFAKGLDSQVIDLLFIGDVNKEYLLHLTNKVEKMINRKIRYVVYSLSEKSGIDWSSYPKDPLLLWES